MADTKLFKVKVCSHIFFFIMYIPESLIPNLTSASSLYRVPFFSYYKVGHFLDKKIMK